MNTNTAGLANMNRPTAEPASEVGQQMTRLANAVGRLEGLIVQTGIRFDGVLAPQIAQPPSPQAVEVNPHSPTGLALQEFNRRVDVAADALQELIDRARI